MPYSCCFDINFDLVQQKLDLIPGGKSFKKKKNAEYYYSISVICSSKMAPWNISRLKLNMYFLHFQPPFSSSLCVCKPAGSWILHFTCASCPSEFKCYFTLSIEH